MESRLSFHSQLSSIMETMARSTLSQVCSLVDEDTSELRLELSRLLFVNSALTEKVNNLQSELTTARSDAPTPRKHYRTVGVQTVCHWDGDAPVSLVSGPPTIEGIFGKDWCMDLWKDRDPYSVERVSDSPQSSDASIQIAASDVIDEEDDVEDAASSCRRETLSTEEREECLAEEQERLSVGYSVDGSTCNLSFDQDEEQIVSTGEELSSDTEEAFSTHIIPIEEEEEEEEEDDVQFVQESHQEPTINTEGGSKQVQTVAANSENSTAPDKDSRDNFNVLNVETNGDPAKGKFTCQICSKTFFHKSTLTHHMKSHKSNICNVCKQHFPHRTKLNTHKCVPPVLSRRVSRSCELCGKTFANPSALRTHYVVHTGEKPYRCSLCGRGFTQKGNLKCHLRIHTGERPFRCVKCGKTFTQKVNLNHHLMAHKNQEVVGE